MAGLCWFVQIVHYPLFHQIDLEKFPNYEKNHFITGYITIPIMILELLTGLYLLYYHLEMLFVANVVFIGITGLSTMLFQVPIHLKLSQKASRSLINQLIQTNWIRSLSWTARMIIMYLILIQYDIISI